MNTTNMKKIALIWCGDIPGEKSLSESIERALRSDGQRWDILSPNDKDFLARAPHYEGYVISGSPKSVIEDAESPFVKKLFIFIREVYEHSLSPIIGLCFGSQAIAVALGGKVKRNLGGHFKLGVESLTWNATADSSRWPETTLPAVLVKSHGECVSLLPRGSIQLASSITTENEIFLIDERFLGIQGHPEANNHLLRQGFMPYYESMFDNEQWLVIERESKQELHSQPVLDLGRRLLNRGRL